MLVGPHIDTVYTLCLRISGNVTEADDLAQETLLRALSKHKSYDPAWAFRPWLLTVTINLCRDRLRTVWWRRVLPMSQPHCSSLPDPEHAVQATERDAQVRNAMATLPLLYREALALFYLDDMSYQEMSQITGSSLSALKQQVQRGQIMLRETMGKLYPEMVPET
ncbi:MAG: RNA polymerase sigma-70 factor (ECF subfamily) [Myxococcota bacterium]|jgi:RNA polymerase sigma-70 factor (ECF subfamily)